MQPLGYTNWQNIEVAIDRAKLSAEAQNMDVASNFGGADKIPRSTWWR